MCTLVAFFGVSPDVPLVVAANRDEFYGRAAAPAGVLSESPRVVGGRDLSKGGTWLGVSEGGFFVGVTNQREWKAPDSTRRSRGDLVLAALREGSTDRALALLRATDAREYNAFNLLLGDARALWVAYARDHDAAIALEELPRGIWVLNNDTIGSRDFPKASRARDLAAPISPLPWGELAPHLPTLLADHQLPSIDDVPPPPTGAFLDREHLRVLQALCVHTPAYGTRSATIAAFDDGRVRSLLFADGPPCITPFADVTHLFER